MEYRISDAKIVTASVPEDEWEYQDVKKFSFDADQNMMKFAGEKYQYDQRRGILPAGKQFFRRNPGGFQGKIGPSRGQKAR